MTEILMLFRCYGNEKVETDFDRGCEAARACRGPVTSLINGKNVTANDDTFALAA